MQKQIKKQQIQTKNSKQIKEQKILKEKQPKLTMNSQQKKKASQNNKNQQVQNILLTNLQHQIKQKTIQINSLLAQQSINDINVNKKVKQLLKLQTKFHNIKDILTEDNNEMKQNTNQNVQLNINQKIQLIQKQAEQYEPTMQEIQQRKAVFTQQNGDGWTDATQSETGSLNPDDIMVFDDQILDQICGKMKQQDSDNQDQQEEKVNLEELQDDFVRGQQSDQHFLFGKHKDQKFCVSVCSNLKEGLIMSGGGDDQLYFYKFKPQNQKNPQNQQQKKSLLIEPFKTIKHNETVNQIDLSFDKQFMFSLTQKEILATDLKTLETQKLQIDPPSQFSCHRQGGVFLIGNSFNVQIFNVKGFKFYDSYCLDQQISLMKWTPSGKQIVAACDNKLRIITPKTQQVTKVTGTQFHQGQITALSLTENTIFSGCIDGYVYASNLTKGHILGGSDQMEAMINTLYAVQNYLIVGPSINKIYWYDSNKLKRLFETQLKGNSSDIVQLHNKNFYAISDIQGEIQLFDKRSPLQSKKTLKAGNTVHQMFYDQNVLLAACQDGCVRAWDLRKFQL